MAINLAQKYSSKVDERFVLGSMTDRAVGNKDYEFTGVNTVKVYSIPTVAQGDYTRSGSDRYGTPTELQDTVQTLTLTQDRAFTFTVDKGNDMEQVGVKNAGRALRRQIDEVTIPEVDAYRIAALTANAGTVKNSETITSSNAYTSLLAAQAVLGENKVNMAGRICYCTYAFLTAIKTDANFVKASDIAQEMLVKGQMGEIDGVALVPMPSTYMPDADTNFVLTHPIALVSPVTISEYKTHIDPPGISGVLVEGRIIYDAFVMDNKAKAVYVSTQAAA